jgi:hypothetical protein
VTVPALVFADEPRSADPGVCPYLRLDAAGIRVAPYHSPADEHVCVAYGAPNAQSLRQQELVCLGPGHVDCPRYLRGLPAESRRASAATGPAIPRATVASILILVLSAGISFGFVIQRGGIDLPVVAGGPAGSEPVAIVATPTLTPDAASDGPTDGATSSISPPEEPAATPTMSPTTSPTATPTPTPEPTTPPSPRPKPTPRPTATPASTRYALLRPCPDRKRCWIYTVHAGDNLFSIAHYFGHPLSTIYAWNPQYANGGRLRAGDPIRMPPPSR